MVVAAVVVVHLAVVVVALAAASVVRKAAAWVKAVDKAEARVGVKVVVVRQTASRGAARALVVVRVRRCKPVAVGKVRVRAAWGAPSLPVVVARARAAAVVGLAVAGAKAARVAALSEFAALRRVLSD